MDIKSTKIHNSHAFKLFILILSVVSMFLFVYEGETLISFYNENYSIDDVLAKRLSDSVLGNGNSEFARKIREDTKKLYDLSETYVSDEYVEDGTSFKAKEASILEQMENEIKTEVYAQKISQIEDMYVYDYSNECYVYPDASRADYLNNFSSDDQIRAEQYENMTTFNGSDYFAITYINGREYYKGYPLDKVYVDESEIRSNVSESYSRSISSARATFKSDYDNLKSYLAGLKNYDYFVQNKENGLVYTNIKGAKTIDDAVEKYETHTSEYTAYVRNEDFYYSNGLRTLFTNDKTVPCFIDEDGNITYIYQDNYFEYCFGNFDMEKYDVLIHVNTSPSSIVKGDDYWGLYDRWLQDSSNLRRNTIVFNLSVMVWLATLILSVYASGRVDENGEILLAPIDKLPNSIHFILSAALIFGLVYTPFYVYLEASGYEFNPSMWVCAIVSLSSAVLIELLTSIGRQAKKHVYFKNTLIYIIIIKNYRKIKKWLTSGVDKLTNNSIKKRILMVFYLYVFVVALAFLLILNLDYLYESTALMCLLIAMMIILTIAAAVYIRKISGGLDRVLSALSKAESGDFDYTVEVGDMPEAIKPLATKANNLTNGLDKALDEAVRSERMKTELITNVSHDLKTPLTSIITYTDLLKHCNIEDEKAREFIGVLDEKSTRLKVLIDDLVEASKASSGNLKLNLTKIDLNELTEQIFGEYEDSLKEQNLELRYDIPSEPTYVIADGQRTYRVIDNLFSNARKYAMPGTRVYLELRKDDKYAIIEMKNISKDEMHFDVERLCDRFVRGDESRNSETEGSGLGLSIAKSLTELQDGIFEISVDGDLFKVTIKLPLNKEIVPQMIGVDGVSDGESPITLHDNSKTDGPKLDDSKHDDSKLDGSKPNN